MIWLNTVGQGDYTPMMTDPASPSGAQTASRIDPNWVFFLALGLIWGSSYLFIKLAVDDFGTFTLVAGRLIVGAALLWTVVLFAKQTLPRDPRMYGHLFVMGVINITIPFLL